MFCVFGTCFLGLERKHKYAALATTTAPAITKATFFFDMKSRAALEITLAHCSNETRYRMRK